MTLDASRAALALPSPAPLPVPPGFVDELARLGVTLTDEQLVQLGDYLARLLAMNEQMNLTAITDPVSVWTRHGFDALTLLPALRDVEPGGAVIDVGSGGGVPGIPLAIARPDLRVTLLEATQKKAAFLEAVAAAVGLSNVTVVAGRAEQEADGPLARSFDAVTARAVAPLRGLLPWTAIFARPGGRLLFIKGQRAAQELTEAKGALKQWRCQHQQTLDTPTGKVVVLQVG